MRVIEALPFRFDEYKVGTADQANQRLACWAYERAVHECNNQYGIFGAMKVKECVVAFAHQTVGAWLRICVNRHVMMDRIKTYWPEKFVTSNLLRPVPNPAELFDD